MNMENEGTSVATAVVPSENAEGWTESTILTVAQTTVGQSLLKLVDRFLWVIEKSAQWSLPSQEVTTEENGKTFGKMELVRPLPWILFLPGLVILRAIRGSLNLGASIFGYPQTQPSGMVKFVQKGRRRLRALNLKAVKSARRNAYGKDKRLSIIEAKKALITSIKLTLSTLSCLDTSTPSPSPPPTKIRISGNDLETALTPEEKSTTESAGSPIQAKAKRRFSDISSEESEDETLESKINRLASESSSNDVDFNPVDCSTESSTESSEIELADVSADELNSLRQEAEAIMDREFYDPNELTSPQKVRPMGNDDRAANFAEMRNAEEAQFHSPSNNGTEGETTFYSPISSKGGSPERSMSPYPDVETNSHKGYDFINGDVKSSTESTPSGTLIEEVTNGVLIEKRGTNIAKYHHKGKRTSFGNRKRK